jgi:TRAP-type C4-dicarboxylate transport system permease large subunit
VQALVIIVFNLTNLSVTLLSKTPGSKKNGAPRITDMKLGSARIRNILLILLLVPLIILVGIWGGWFGPLELATCTARGGQIIGDYGSGDV